MAKLVNLSQAELWGRAYSSGSSPKHSDAPLAQVVALISTVNFTLDDRCCVHDTTSVRVYKTLSLYCQALLG